MRLLLVSDSHDRWDNLSRAIAWGQQEGCAALLFAGDFISPLGVSTLAQFPGEIHMVLGNNDGDGVGLRDQLASVIGDRATLHYDFGESIMDLTMSGVRVHMNHYPHLARLAAESGRYDLVVFGHTHLRHEERLENGTLLVNPGEVMGFRTGIPSAAVVDLAQKEVRFVDLRTVVV